MIDLHPVSVSVVTKQRRDMTDLFGKIAPFLYIIEGLTRRTELPATMEGPIPRMDRKRRLQSILKNKVIVSCEVENLDQYLVRKIRECHRPETCRSSLVCHVLTVYDT